MLQVTAVCDQLAQLVSSYANEPKASWWSPDDEASLANSWWIISHKRDLLISKNLDEAAQMYWPPNNSNCTSHISQFGNILYHGMGAQKHVKPRADSSQWLFFF